MPVTPTIIEFVTDPQLLGLSISPAQETLLRSINGLALLNEEQPRAARETRQVTEIGRRGDQEGRG